MAPKLRHIFITTLVLCLAGFSSLSAADKKITVLSWEDLVPAFEPLANPFAELDAETISSLESALRDRSDRRQGMLEDGSEADKAARLREAELESKGVDLDAAEKAIAAMWQEIQRRDQEVVSDLDGALVRLPGYALPLEMSDVGVTEMLLVPFVGACIHVPPPPPNQTVIVRMHEPYIVDNLYEPVWITGTLTVERSSHALALVDGQSDVPVGYALRATAIEPYR